MSVLTRKSHRPGPELTLASGLTLLCGRAHEVCGPSRHLFAAALAAQTQGPILWIRPPGSDGHLNGDGLAEWVEPGRILFVRAASSANILWAMEEGLRSGVVPLVIAEMHEPPPLTPIRRLHLAAEAAPGAPTGLLLTPGEGGAQGVETRWHMAPAPGWAGPSGQPAWTLRRTRARLAPEARWRMEKGKNALEIREKALPDAA